MRDKVLHIRGLVAMLVAAGCLLLPAMVRGQASTGGIVGTVVDANGGGLPGASITVTNPAMGFTRTAVAEEGGLYRFPSLPTGSYTVKVELAGFATVTTEGVTVSVATTRTINVTMKQAKVSENVTVTAEVPLVETSAAIGTVVDQQQLESLPLNGRQFANLGVLAPGTMLGYNTDPTKPGQLVVQLDGGSGRNVNYIMDGGDNTDDTIGGALQNFNLESVQEFKIQTMQYKAEYGRSSGGVLTVVSKTGSNEFHGAAWEFGRRKSLNTETESEKLAGSGKSDYTRDQYGASFGGPIVKDMVHFFATYERTTQDTNYSIENPAPVPSLSGVTVPLPFKDELGTAKMTYDIDAKNYVQVRYGYQKNSQKYGQGSTTSPSALGTVTNKYSSILAGYTAQLSADMLNEFVYQHTKFDDTISADSNDPFLVYPDGFTIGQNINTPQSTHQIKNQYKDDFSFSKDIAGHSHDFKVGVAYVDEPTLSGDFSVGTTGQYILQANTTGSGPAYVVTDITKFGGFSGNSNPNKQYSTYVQDDWKISSTFTLNAGLRYDYYAALYLDQRTNPIWQALSTQTTYTEGYLRDFANGQGGIIHNDKNGWAPRVGFSWDLSGTGRQIIRGGVGRFYDFPYINATVLFPTSAVQSTGYGVIYNNHNDSGILNADGTFFQPGQPLPVNQITGNAGSAPNEIASPSLRSPHSDQVSLGYSWQVNDRIGLTADAVTVQYRNLPYRFRANPIDPTTGAARFPQFGNFRMWAGNGFADYHGLNLGMHMRGDKYELQGFYTLSRATGNILGGADEFRITRVEYQPDLGQVRDQSINPYDPTCSGKCVGPLDTDATHRITLAGTYQLPAGFALSGMFRFHTGTPYTKWAGTDLNGDGYAFDLPPGVSHVNSERGANFSQLDLRLAYKLDFAKDLGAEVFAEMFNVFNEKNPANYDGNCGYDPNHPDLGCQNTDLGQPGAYAGDPAQGEQRLVQVGLRLHF